MLDKLLSIRGKISGLLASAVCLLALIDIVLVPQRYAEAETEALTQRAEAEASLLAEAVAPALEFQQLDSARDLLGSALGDELVAWAAIYDPEGHRLAAVGPHGSLSRISPQPGPLDTRTDFTVAAAAPVRSGGLTVGLVTVALRTKRVIEAVAKTRETMMWQALIVAGIAIALGLWLSGTITRPLLRITDAAGRIASGDISRTVPHDATRDEVGALSQAFGTMSRRLRELVQKIGSTAEQLAVSAAGMFSEVRQQEALSTQQTASLEEIQRTLETLSTAAEQVEVDARTVREMAGRNLTSSQQIAERTRLLSAHSDRIGEILSLIQDIADRSDLLALNAALEGTKAGEVGRGFSLVAAEMRRLSEHVKDSVRDIRKLVADMREASHASVMATEEGIKLSHETSTAAAKISEAVARQREGTSQVKSSADEIVRVVNESLHGRAETTNNAEALLQLSQNLKETVTVFRLEETKPAASDGRRS